MSLILLFFATLPTVRWNLKIVLICIFLIANDDEHILRYFSAALLASAPTSRFLPLVIMFGHRNRRLTKIVYWLWRYLGVLPLFQIFFFNNLEGLAANLLWKSNRILLWAHLSLDTSEKFLLLFQVPHCY